MDKDALARIGPALDQYLECFAGCAVAPTRRLIATYIRGQLGSLARKSVKPMALEAGVPPRTLQELLSLHRWDGDLLIATLQRRVRRAHPSPQAIGILFESRCVKKGDRTPGVARQTSGSAGRPRNCVVLQHLGFSDGEFHCLLDSAVYLPESWTADRARCEAAGVPNGTKHRTKTQIVSELVRRAEGNGLSLLRLVLPAEYSEDAGFMASLTSDGRAVSLWPEARDRGAAVEPDDDARRQLLRAATEARRVLDARMDEVGLDHFEVRTYRSLTRHLALSAASLLFLAEGSDRPRRERGSIPMRSHG